MGGGMRGVGGVGHGGEDGEGVWDEGGGSEGNYYDNDGDGDGGGGGGEYSWSDDDGEYGEYYGEYYGESAEQVEEAGRVDRDEREEKEIKADRERRLQRSIEMYSAGLVRRLEVEDAAREERDARAKIRSMEDKRRTKSEDLQRLKQVRNAETKYKRNRKRWRFLLFRLLTIHEIRLELRSRLNRRQEQGDGER